MSLEIAFSIPWVVSQYTDEINKYTYDLHWHIFAAY